MNKLIKELFREEIKKYIAEDTQSMDDWYESHYQMTYEIFNKIQSKQKITFDLMPVTQYHNALKEFMKFGEFLRFPTKYVLDWKELILENISKLQVLTEIAGHTSHFPYDEFYSVFDYNHKTNQENNGEFTRWCKKMYKNTKDEKYLKKYNFETAYEFLDVVKKIDNYLPLFSNGQWVLSDYGLKPLWKLGEMLVNEHDPNKIIVLINRVLDVTHQRSDLAELFIQGGSKSLTYISNS